MRNLILTFIGLLMMGCDSFETKRLYRKYIQTSSIKIEWFYYSTLSNTTPDYIILSTKTKTDTICIADNIVDVNFYDSALKIDFAGSPKRYGKLINMKKYEIKPDFLILCDTTKTKNYTKTRSFFLKDDIFGSTN